ncbi:Cas10/Cmr2 second palm domain-containing protein [Micromonospora matsumotoense]|uniref:Cas10/Cmr2 second palm domain-containing protein n=1 Tax=Micromonospora matsumotoense TaxID=121616 RepID=UPI003D8A2431
MTGGMFIDIAAVRIGDYLSRTPDLKGRRGASAWLSHASHRAGLPDWLATATAPLHHRPEVNQEAGEADGLIPLRIPAGPAGDSRSDGGAEDVARTVVDALRRRLPGVWLRANWATADSYLEAYRAMREPGAGAGLEAFPPLPDLPVLATCARCRVDPAVAAIDIHEEGNVPVCADCEARYADRYRRPGLWHEHVPVGAETDLLEALSLTPRQVVQHFTELAALGAEDGCRNHLATVHIDGNGLGALFDHIARYGDRDLKARVSARVSAATRVALVEATRTVLDSSRTVPVIPHLVGGDDVLVSVVADRAWRFVTTYLEAFADRMRGVDGLAEHLPDGQRVTGSAGMVFAHATFPFRRSAELAEGALKTAKQEHQGRDAAVGWLDVTRDGEQQPRHRATWTTRALADLGPALAALAAVPPSGRAVCARLIDPDRPGLSAARLREQARRLDRGDVLDPFLTHGGPAAVADALSLVRWWR